MTVPSPGLRASPAGDALAAAERSGVRVRALTSNDDLGAAVRLFAGVWNSVERGTPLSEDVLRAFDLSGNYVRGAFDAAGVLAGASVAFACIGERPELHSHSTAVAAAHRRAGVGVALKLDQRAFALERGIDSVSWTFDPLVRRNAELNLARLGAEVVSYMENVYGIMADALNGEDESDRLLVRWHLLDDAVIAAVAGVARRVASGGLLPSRLEPGPDGSPVLTEARGRFTCLVPERIEELRGADPALAGEWRLATREVIGRTLAAGGRIPGLDNSGAFVLEEGVAT